MPGPTYLYYANAFASNADAGGGTNPVTIPSSAAPDGTVSYYGGYTDPYEYNLLTNPAAQPITRPVMNQLFYDITNNIQQYQNYGTPPWFNTAQVPGSSAGYPIYARVYYSGAVYESQIALNTNTPGADNTWLKISGASDGIQPGMIIDYSSPVAPAGYLLCDGSSYVRTSYSNLFAAATFTQTVTTNSASTNLTVTNANTTMYPGMRLESANFSGGVNTIASITNNTTIVLTSMPASSGSTTVTFFPWGASDTTHFYVPNLIGTVTAGSGGTLVGNPESDDAVGQTTGVASHMVTLEEIPNHNHLPARSSFVENGTGTEYVNTDGNKGVVDNSTLGIQGYTTQTALSLLQPTTIVYKIIKT